MIVFEIFVLVSPFASHCVILVVNKQNFAATYIVPKGAVIVILDVIHALILVFLRIHFKF
jgi:hypothetical protein